MLAGANACAIENADGEWEIVQFANATLTGTDEYLLSQLLRGQLGTEGAMRSPVAAGARFILLDEAVEPIGLSPAEASLPLDYAFGPAQNALDDVSYVRASHQYALVPLRPYSPTEVRGVKTAGGDVQLTWIRRTRVGGDGWEQIDVPLGEASESYAIDIRSGSSVIRTLTSSVPSVTYAAAQIAVDFGVLPVPLTVEVYQVSSTRGRGAGKRVALYLS